MYKIAVYAICKNEIENLNDGIKNTQEADYICILDTGSTDGTYEKLLEYQKKNPKRYIIKQKIYNPGRFDQARNDSLKLIPSDTDICVCIDLDERLANCGSDLVKSAWFDGCLACCYLYAHDFSPSGTPSRTIGYNKIHNNSIKGKGKYPLHEILCHEDYQHSSPSEDCICILPGPFILVTHHHIKANSANYLELAKLRYLENKEEDVSALYLAHEYFYNGHFQDCIDFIENVILKECKLETQLFRPSTYMFLGKAYASLHQFNKAIDCFKIGIQCDKTYRDNYLCLAHCYAQQQDYYLVIDTINECFRDSRRYGSGLEQPNTGDGMPGDLLTTSYYKIGAIDMAYISSKIAVNLNPADELLQNNYRFFESLMVH